MEGRLSLAVLLGLGNLAKTLHKKIPKGSPGLDIRCYGAKGIPDRDDRDTLVVGRLHPHRLAQILKAYETEQLILCGRLAPQMFVFEDDLLSEFNMEPTASMYFKYLEEKMLKAINVQVIGAHRFMPEITPGRGVLVPPPRRARLPKLYADDVFESLPAPLFYRATHSAIAFDGRLLIWETKTGTDKMIRSYTRRVDAKKPKGAIFYKFPLKDCNVYFDMPVIGPKTVELLSKASVSGIVVHHTHCYIDDRETTFQLCRDHGIFLVGTSLMSLSHQD